MPCYSHPRAPSIILAGVFLLRQPGACAQTSPSAVTDLTVTVEPPRAGDTSSFSSTGTSRRFSYFAGRDRLPDTGGERYPRGALTPRRAHSIVAKRAKAKPQALPCAARDPPTLRRGTLIALPRRKQRTQLRGGSGYVPYRYQTLTLSNAVTGDALARGATATRFAPEAGDHRPKTLLIQSELRVIGHRA